MSEQERIKRFTINFDVDLLKEFDEKVGERQRGIRINQILRDYILSKDASEIEMPKKRLMKNTSILLDEKIVRQFIEIVGERNLSAGIRALLKNFINKENKNVESI